MNTSTIARIPEDFFEPPDTAGTRRRRLRRRIALVSLAVVLVAAGGVASYQFVRHSCRGLTWPDVNLSKVDGECIGWTIENAFAFDPAIADVTERIASANRDVRQAADERGANFVRVAVLMPMTAATSSSMTTPTIRHALQGVAVAQRRANLSADFGTPNPLIQLVLMNEGRDQTHWTEMTRELKALKDGPHPVVAAVGLGVSIPATRDAAIELHNLGIPAIGGVLTATNLSTPGLFQVAPSNADYVTALHDYLKTRPELKTAILAFDNNNDYYVRTLREAFERTELEPYTGGRVKSFIGSLGVRDATPAVFDDVKQYVCINNADMVFYAGRDRDLSALVDQLALRRQCGHNKPVVILTGSTGLNLADGVDQVMTDHQITLIDASSSDAVKWQQGRDAPAGYEAFHRAFIAQFAETELADGYAIGHHDAVATAAWAIRRFSQQAAGRVPTGLDVLGQITNLNDATHAVPAAGGTLTFDDRSGGWPHGKVVVILQLPDTDINHPPYITS